MKRFSFSGGVASSLVCLCLGALLPGACASEQNTLEPEEETGGTNAGKSSGGKASGGASAGKPGSFGGSSAGKTAAGGQANDGGAPTEPDAGEASMPMAGSGGTAVVPTDKCQTDANCTQVEGSCFVCEQVKTIKDCVDKGPPVCDNGTLDPCEVCEIGDEADCTK